MTEQSMIDRMARALHRSTLKSHGYPESEWEAEWTCETRDARDDDGFWHDQARAALTAMLEPTWPMLQAADGEQYLDPDACTDHRADLTRAWQAMIHAALSEKPQ
jgi:hypothetical protein